MYNFSRLYSILRTKPKLRNSLNLNKHTNKKTAHYTTLPEEEESPWKGFFDPTCMKELPYPLSLWLGNEITQALQLAVHLLKLLFLN